MAQVSFVGIVPNAEGAITRQMYIDAIPGRFRMFDQNGDGTLSSTRSTAGPPEVVQDEP